MSIHIFVFSTLIVTLTVAEALPVDVEIEKQRLIKFPDEDSTSHPASTGNSSNANGSSMDKAQRILQEIEKINHALGYVRKQPEQSKLPPILDSSQYLFPKPALQPFHQQNHQTSGMNGGTILIPSIRAVLLDHQYLMPYSNSEFIEYNGATRKLHATYKHAKKMNEYFFRPLPTAQGFNEQHQLRTHFAIPVRLYKINMEEYIHKHAPEEYRLKGYKIVGDVGNFYEKNKQSNQVFIGSKNKSTTKYHLFFLPSEAALNEDSKQDTSQISKMKLEAKEESPDSNSREEKVIGIQRPYKIQTTATSSSNGGGSSTNVTTQIIRKRIVPKPLRDREPTVSEMTEQQHSLESTATVATNPNANMNTNLNSMPPVSNSPNQNSNVYNARPGALNIPNLGNAVRPVDLKNSTASNAIKNAFQNIFKFPFRQENKPDVTTEQFLQMPPKPSFTALAYQPAQSFYEVIGAQHPQKGNDYHWEDEASNSASDDEEDNSSEHEEKHIFGNRHNAEQKTQMEAVKQGGIIIQRLKVRKGGIAIAGPGGVATAGSGGTAIVGPGGYALTHPRSLTIAGPGAKVIAIPSGVDLKDALQRTNLSEQSIPREGKIVATGPTVYYSPATAADASEDDYSFHRSKVPIVFEENLFPYYGGMRGQTLHVVKIKDGTDNMYIIGPAAPINNVRSSHSLDDQTQNTPSVTISFEKVFNRIQVAAARLVALQESAKQKGSFSAEDNRVYSENLLELGQAAQSLANLQQSGQIKDFSLLLQPDFQMPHKQPLFPAESVAGPESLTNEQKVEEVIEQQLHEEDFLPPNTEDPYEDVSDTVAVTAPKKDASVAEAKPVGLSIAGEGGVASSKPNAVALSGRNGLAVSAPKATAIAGVSAEEAAAFSVSVPNKNNLVIKTVNRLPQHSVYDDYSEDYSDVLSVRSAFVSDPVVTHNKPPFVHSKKTKDLNAAAGSRGGGNVDSFINKWKTMVAEDYSASSRSAPRKTMPLSE